MSRCILSVSVYEDTMTVGDSIESFVRAKLSDIHRASCLIREGSQVCQTQFTLLSPMWLFSVSFMLFMCLEMASRRNFSVISLKTEAMAD